MQIQLPDAKNLNKEAPRSPYDQLNGFAILPRTIDKCRAVLMGQQGEYHFNCPLDQMLFAFKGIDAEEFKKFVADGHSDDEIGSWVYDNGSLKTYDEIAEWSATHRKDFSYTTNEKKDWFIGECQRLGLDPEKTTLFDMLEEDDRVSFAVAE